MLCPYCNNVRPANSGPCPFCGAASTLGWGPMDSQQAFNQPMLQQQASPTAQGLSFPQAGAMNYAPPSPPTAPGGQDNGRASLLKRYLHSDHTSSQGAEHDNSLWGQVMAPQPTQAPMQPPNNGTAFPKQPSLLPVPYQPGLPNRQQGQFPQQDAINRAPTVLPQGFPTTALVPASSEALPVPAQPATIDRAPTEDAPIYVAPMYTKPRPIIPRYRAISGLLSVLIVSILLCTGVGLYAKASGKLSFLRVLYGGETLPQSETPTPIPTFAAPKLIFQPGPASNIITSASTASSIDFHTAVPLIEATTFKPGETIFLTYSVHPRAPGTVLIKWYTNDHYYESSPPMQITSAKDTNGYTVMQFAEPLKGSVELYWNNQLGIRLYFVVTN